MVTKTQKIPKKRISISCSPELYESLSRLSAASGGSMVAMPTQMLESNVAIFNRLADAMLVAQNNKSEGMEKLGEIMNEKLIDAAQISLQLNGKK